MRLYLSGFRINGFHHSLERFARYELIDKADRISVPLTHPRSKSYVESISENYLIRGGKVYSPPHAIGGITKEPIGSKHLINFLAVR